MESVDFADRLWTLVRETSVITPDEFMILSDSAKFLDVDIQSVKVCGYCHTAGGESIYHPGTCANCGGAL